MSVSQLVGSFSDDIVEVDLQLFVAGDVGSLGRRCATLAYPDKIKQFLHELNRLPMSSLSNTHHLVVADEFFGEEINNVDQLNERFRGLSRTGYMDLLEAYELYESSFGAVEAEDNDGSFLIGRAYDTFKTPHSTWHPGVRNQVADRQLSPSTIHRLLVYSPSVSVALPGWYVHRDADEEYPESMLKYRPLDETPLYEFLSLLLPLRQFLDDGSVTLVPDSFYVDACSWKPNKSINGPIHELSINESKDERLRKILEKLPYEDDEHAPHASDNAEDNAWRYEEDNRYIDPLNEINEDIVVQSLLGSTLVSGSPHMYELLQAKFRDEAKSTMETTWESVSTMLPGLQNIPIDDLASVRANEDAFHLWRSALRSSIRAWESELETRGSLSAETALQIFDDRTLPIRMNLEQKIKSNTLKSKIEPGVVSFVIGATAAAIVKPDPTTALATGSISSSLKVAYDILKARGYKTERSLLRLFSSFRDL